MVDIDESKSKPKILVFGFTLVVEWLNKKELSFVFSNSPSDFKDCQGILYCPPSYLYREGHLEEAIDLFEEDVSRLGGIEGVVLYIWVTRGDACLKEEMVKRLRLEERGCVWEFGAGSEIIPEMDQFFQENFQAIVKPAKREKRED